MDLELAKFLFNVLTFLVAGGTGFYVYLSSKDKVTNDRINTLEEDLKKENKTLSERVAKVEAVSESAPNHADISKVYDSINQLAATVNQLVGENRGQSDTLKLILNQITAKGMK